MRPSILVAGIGNLFKGDDAFGIEVARRLAARLRDDSVEVIDFGVRGLDLAYTLLDRRHRLVILVDAVARGDAPGTVSLIEPDLDGVESGTAETHGMDPARVLGWVRAHGGSLGSVVLVGCEPGELANDEELKLGLSPPVEAAVEQAMRIIEEIIGKEKTYGQRSSGTHEDGDQSRDWNAV